MNYTIYILRNGKEITPFFTYSDLTVNEARVIGGHIIRCFRDDRINTPEKCIVFSEIIAAGIKRTRHLPRNKKYTTDLIRGGARKKLKII